MNGAREEGQKLSEKKTGKPGSERTIQQRPLNRQSGAAAHPKKTLNTARKFGVEKRLTEATPRRNGFDRNSQPLLPAVRNHSRSTLDALVRLQKRSIFKSWEDQEWKRLPELEEGMHSAGHQRKVLCTELKGKCIPINIQYNSVQ